jgi:multiple sugar transport system permease protein
VWPAVELVRASLSRYSITGLRKGDAGLQNFRNVLGNDSLPTVLTNTVVWVVAVVVLTILISLGVAQFLTKDFWGRRVVRWAVIVPWAASLVITARLFSLIYSYYYGTLNAVLLKLHVVDTPIDFIGSDRLIMPSMIAVGVFVSIPFTAYVFVAAAREAGVLVSAVGPTAVRLVTHLDITRADAEKAASVLGAL